MRREDLRRHWSPSIVNEPLWLSDCGGERFSTLILAHPSAPSFTEAAAVSEAVPEGSHRPAAAAETTTHCCLPPLHRPRGTPLFQTDSAEAGRPPRLQQPAAVRPIALSPGRERTSAVDFAEGSARRDRVSGAGAITRAAQARAQRQVTRDRARSLLTC